MVHGIRLLEGEAKWYRNRYGDPQNSVNFVTKMIFITTGITVAVAPTQMLEVSRNWAMVEAGGAL